jgi:hypothetical protein
MKRRRNAIARRSHRRPPVRKNFVFLLPLAVPLVIGGVSLAAVLAMKKKAESVISLPAVIGAGTGYIIARKYKQDVPMQAAAMIVGYAGGMAVANAMKSKEEKAAEQAYEENWRWYNPMTWFTG